MAQHTQLILTLLEGLGSRSRLQCDLASQLLLVIFEDHSIRAEQVRPGHRALSAGPVQEPPGGPCARGSTPSSQRALNPRGGGS